MTFVTDKAKVLSLRHHYKCFVSVYSTLKTKNII